MTNLPGLQSVATVCGPSSPAGQGALNFVSIAHIFVVDRVETLTCFALART